MSDAPANTEAARRVGERWIEHAENDALRRVLELAEGAERCGWATGIAARLAEAAAGEELDAREREAALARLGFAGGEGEREPWARAFLAGALAEVRRFVGAHGPETEHRIYAVWIARPEVASQTFDS